MGRIRSRLLAIGLVAGVMGCALPGTTSPTPFAFPTPHLTLTALRETLSTSTPTSDTSPAEPSATPENANMEATATPFPTAPVEGNLRPNGSPVTAIPLSELPTIDGDLSDWPSERHSISEVVYGVSQWTGGEDASATYALGWDNANLYVGIQVNDDVFVQSASGRTLFKGDSVDLLLDTALAPDLDSGRLTADDFQIGLSPGNFVGRDPESYRWFPRSREAALASPSVASRRTDNGYVLEARLPWAIFGLEPIAGGCYGFALSVSDNDLAGTAVQQTMVSSVSTRILTDPTSWGTLILGGGPACQSAAGDG